MTDKINQDRNELLVAYAELELSEGGKLILADLERRFNHDEVFDPDPLIMAGKAREQGVVKYIHKRIRKGKEL